MTAPTSRPETGTATPQRCTAVEPMESGLYRCAQSGRHDEHYFTYYRAALGAEPTEATNGR